MSGIPNFHPFKDCDDSSDEKNCRTISFDKEKYLKNKPPSPPKGMDKLQISVRCKSLKQISVHPFFPPAWM